MTPPFHSRSRREHDEILRGLHERMQKIRDAQKRGEDVEPLRQELDQYAQKHQLGDHADE